MLKFHIETRSICVIFIVIKIKQLVCCTCIKYDVLLSNDASKDQVQLLTTVNI